MRDLLMEVVDHLIDSGLAKQKDKDIFKDYTPDQPDDCIIVREYAGSGSPWYCEVSQRSLQLVARSKKSQTAMATAWAIYNKLKPTEGIVDYLGHPCIIHMRNTPVKIARDEKGRVSYAFNMGVITN